MAGILVWDFGGDVGGTGAGFESGWGFLIFKF